MNHLLVVGFGYTAQYIADYCLQNGWQITALSRHELPKFSAQNIEIPVVRAELGKIKLLTGITHLLITAPPTHEIYDPFSGLFHEDPNKFFEFINAMNSLKWIGYFSSTGVYGNHDGAWVDEVSTCHPADVKAKRRLEAEQFWLDLLNKIDHKININIFRLAGIYGPGQNAIQRIIDGKNYTIIKPNHFFSRIYVTDLARCTWLAMKNNLASGIYNISDDMPEALNVVEQYAAKLLELEPLQEFIYEDNLVSEQARAFYASNKRVCNFKIKKYLDLELIFPTYKEGLKHCKTLAFNN